MGTATWASYRPVTKNMDIRTNKNSWFTKFSDTRLIVSKSTT